MSQLPDPNPYAPSRVEAEPNVALYSQHFPTIGVLAATFAGIVLSGATFGLIMAGVVAMAEPSDVSEIVVLVPLGVVVGVVIAGLTGTPTVLVAFCLAAPLVPFARGWAPHQARRFAAICGFFSRSSPIVLLDLRDPMTWLFALIPGVFGAVGSLLFVRWIFREARPTTAV